MKSLLRGASAVPLRSIYERNASDVSDGLQRIFDEVIHEIDVETSVENSVEK